MNNIKPPILAYNNIIDKIYLIIDTHDLSSQVQLIKLLHINAAFTSQLLSKEGEIFFYKLKPPIRTEFENKILNLINEIKITDLPKIEKTDYQYFKQEINEILKKNNLYEKNNNNKKIEFVSSVINESLKFTKRLLHNYGGEFAYETMPKLKQRSIIRKIKNHLNK